MSSLEDAGIDDLLNANFQNDEDQLPDCDENEQIFGDVPEEGENVESAVVMPVKVQPKKRTVVNPRPRLNVEVLRGARGLHTIEDYFKDVIYKGRGHEKEDLDQVMRRLQHWGHRMYPTLKFDDILTNIERLGKKKPLQVHMSRYRLGMLENLNNHADIYVADEEDAEQAPIADEPFDEFDALLDEQIAISKVNSCTPGLNNSRQSGRGVGSSTNVSTTGSNFGTPSFSRGNAFISTPYTGQGNFSDTSVLATPLPPSQPSTPASKQGLSAEQMARIAENRRLAQERLAAKKQLRQQVQNSPKIIQT